MYATLPELDELRKHGLRDAQGTSYRAFRRTLAPRFARVWLQIALAWTALAALGVALTRLDGSTLGQPVELLIAAGVGGPLVGYALAFLHLFVHEAAHWNLAPERRWNDRLANAFLGALLGLDVRTYRPLHWEHHKHLGTTRDTERSYFEALGPRFLIESLTGLRVLRVLAGRRDARRGAEQRAERARRSHQPWLGAVLNLALLAALLAAGYVAPAIAWCAGLGVFFPFFASVRQVLEHRDPDADPAADYRTRDHGAVNHLFGSGPLASTLGGAGFNRHLLHHLDPQVSCTRLKDLEAFLARTALAPVLDAHRTTYLRQFVRLLRSARGRGGTRP